MCDVFFGIVLDFWFCCFVVCDWIVGVVELVEDYVFVFVLYLFCEVVC